MAVGDCGGAGGVRRGGGGCVGRVVVAAQVGVDGMGA